MRRVPIWLMVLCFIALLAVIAGVLSVIPSGYVAISPHAPIDLDKRIRIDGQLAEPLHGRLALVGVEESSTSILQNFLLGFDRRVSRETQVGNPSSPANVTESTDEIKQSKQVAAEVAFALVGKPAVMTGDGAVVQSVDPQGPAAALLKVGDRIVEANGRLVGTARDVTDVIGSLPVGSAVTLGIRRQQLPVIVKLRTVVPVAGDLLHRSRIGISLGTPGLQIKLPEPVSIKTDNVGGPSAGLAFALSLYDSLSGGDLLGGRYVVATGELALDGEVLPVGGVRQKTIAAQDAGYDLMLVPDSNELEAVKAVHDFCKVSSGKPCLHVLGVASVQQAVALLNDDPAKLATLYGS